MMHTMTGDEMQTVPVPVDSFLNSFRGKMKILGSRSHLSFARLAHFPVLCDNECHVRQVRCESPQWILASGEA